MAIVRSTYPHAEIIEHRHQRGVEGAGRQGCDHRQGSRSRRASAGCRRFTASTNRWCWRSARCCSSIRRWRRSLPSRGRSSGRRRSRAGGLNPLPVVADPFAAKKDEVLLRPDRESQDQSHLSLGSRRQGRHGAGAGGKRDADQAADLVSALPSRAARAVRVRRPVRHDGPAAVPRHFAGAPRLPDRAGDRHGHTGRQDPCRSRRTSAAGSATRCLCIRATSARSSAR